MYSHLLPKNWFFIFTEFFFLLKFHRKIQFLWLSRYKKIFKWDIFWTFAPLCDFFKVIRKSMEALNRINEGRVSCWNGQNANFWPRAVLSICHNNGSKETPGQDLWDTDAPCRKKWKRISLSCYPPWHGPKGNLFKGDDDLNYYSATDALKRPQLWSQCLHHRNCDVKLDPGQRKSKIYWAPN